MSESQLNLVAIAIFMMMLSALVGPLIHLSPAIPAVTTLIVLGLVTADQIQWQGRGTTLVASLLQPAAERQRILCHEAGHFLVAYAFEIPIVGYSLSPWEAWQQGHTGAAGVQFDTTALEAQCQQWTTRPQALERWATVWMAGLAAETITYGSAQGAEGDRQQLREAFRRAGLSETQITLKERWALLQAKQLLIAHGEVHRQLQNAMAERQSVADCCQLLMPLNTQNILAEFSR